MDRQTDGQTDGQTDRQTDRQTNRMHKHFSTLLESVKNGESILAAAVSEKQAKNESYSLRK